MQELRIRDHGYCPGHDAIKITGLDAWFENGEEVVKQVILAEDDADMREILAFWLEGEGYKVIPVCNGWEAIQAAKKGPIDAVVLDLLMPGVDGYQACRYIRHDPSLYKLPVVLFSAVFIDDEERRLGYEVGADDFVMKTSGFNALLLAIDRVIREFSSLERRSVDEKQAALVRAEIEAAAAGA